MLSHERLSGLLLSNFSLKNMKNALLSFKNIFP